jgi:phosphoglycerate dehydrogenase-like enzyme
MTFKVGISRDLLTASGAPCFDPRAFDVLKANPAISWEWVPEVVTEITPEILARYDALHLNLPKVTAASLAGTHDRVKIIARNGVGYDSVNVAACAAKGIMVTNTPLAVRRPVAVAALTLIFALAGQLLKKNELAHTGRWNDRTDFMGQGLTMRTLGVVGAGGIGQELLRLARPFFGDMIAADPFVAPAVVRDFGARMVPLDTLMAEADFVVVTALLTPETRHLVNADRLARMKPSSYFLNLGRGPLVDEMALIAVLQAGRIAGAGLDVTEMEPIQPDNPLLRMENVIITPHALCWTDECFRDIAETALQSIVDVSLGRQPRHVVGRLATFGT